MRIVYFIILGIVFWYVGTFLWGAIWGFLHISYNPGSSNVLNLILLPFAFLISWYLMLRKK